MTYAQSEDSIDYEPDEEDSLPFVKIKEVTDLKALAKESKRDGKVIMIEMSASYCGYCRTLEAEVIKPMLRSGDYKDTALIRHIEIDSYHTITGINGEKTNPQKLSSKYDIFVTPTLLFLDSNGIEVSERIIGVNTLEYYGYYVDKAINEGNKAINN